MTDQSRFADCGRWRIPAQQDVAAKLEVIDELGRGDKVVADLEVIGVADDVHEAAVPILLEPRRAKWARLGWNAVDHDSNESVRIFRRHRHAVAEMVDDGKADVAGKQLARRLDSLHSFSHHLAGDPFFDVARLRRHLLLALAQLEDETDVAEQQHAVGDVGRLFGNRWKLTCVEGEGSRENVRVLLGDEVVKEARRFFRALFHSRAF